MGEPRRAQGATGTLRRVSEKEARSHRVRARLASVVPTHPGHDCDQRKNDREASSHRRWHGCDRRADARQRAILAAHDRLEKEPCRRGSGYDPNPRRFARDHPARRVGLGFHGHELTARADQAKVCGRSAEFCRERVSDHRERAERHVGVAPTAEDGIGASTGERGTERVRVRSRAGDHRPVPAGFVRRCSVVRVVIGHGPHRPTGVERHVPCILSARQVAADLDRRVAGERAQIRVGDRAAQARMRDHHEAPARAKTIDAMLFLVAPLQQRIVQPVDVLGADRQKMHLSHIITMLVHRQRRGVGAGGERDLLIVRDRGDIVTHRFIAPQHIVSRPSAIRQSTPRTRVHVEVGLLPWRVRSNRRVRVVPAPSAERPHGGETMHRAPQVDGSESQPRKSAGRVNRLGFDGARLTRIDSVMQRAVDRSEIAGAVALVLKDGQTVYERAFGWSDREAKRQMTTDAIFRIASQTKALTSVAVMTLVEEGKLSLNDPVSRFIPDFEHTTVATRTDTGRAIVPARRAITLKDLLTHTAGISYGTDSLVAPLYRAAGLGPAAGWGWYTADKNARICLTMDRLATLPFVAQPGERFVYGYNTDILGCVVERVAGAPLDEVLRARITGPLGMKDTYFYLPPDRKARLTTVYA